MSNEKGMSAKDSACPLRSRHKWAWLKNVEIWRIGPRTGSMKVRGLYRCECGARRYGESHITPLTIAAPTFTEDRGERVGGGSE